jgi:hypothetical protein
MQKVYILSLVLLSILSAAAWATPSTQIWNPSTDIQPLGVTHLGIDDYFTVEDRAAGGYSFPTDTGLTYGLLPGVEVGVDILLPQTTFADPLVLNAKYGLLESVLLPAFAVGGYGFGLQNGVTDQNILYGLLAKTFPFGRLSAGYFSGNANLLINSSGQADNAGVILTWDKVVSDKLWLCVDHAGTQSSVGATFYGFSWIFAPNTSVIFAYGTYNNGAKPTITTQLDINI